MLQPGSQIGRYEIQRRLGRGGMGTVYVARDPVLGRLVAIKVFATNLELPDAAQRFAREARTAAALNHPHIVTVHDFGDVSSQPFIVMEYVQGETLADIIRRNAPVSLTEKLRWLEELCSGAAYAHRRGVVHRDIKPTNLMIDRSGRLKILDFGIARMLGTSPGETVSIGTPGYMAPEQILGEAIDQRADLFSIGVVCYELLTYTEAFPGETLPTITHRILTQDPVPLAKLVPTVHPELISLVDRSLRKNPSERFDDVDALRGAISRIRRQIENDPSWDAAVPTVSAERPGAGVSTRGTGSQPYSVPDSADVAPWTPPPDPHRIDREVLARRRTEQIEAGLERSRALLESGDAQGALEACAQVLTLEETHPAALKLEQTIQGIISAQRAESHRQETRHRQRAEQLAAALARAEDALERGEIESALAFARDAIGLDSRSAMARELEAEAMRRLDEEAGAHVTLPDTSSATVDVAPTVLSPHAPTNLAPAGKKTRLPADGPQAQVKGVAEAAVRGAAAAGATVLGLVVLPFVVAGETLAYAWNRTRTLLRSRDRSGAGTQGQSDMPGVDEAMEVRRNPASFAAFGPESIQRGHEFILEIWAYAPEFKNDAWQQAMRDGMTSVRGVKGPVLLRIGSTLTAVVTVPGFDVAAPTDSVAWNGRMANMTFAVTANGDVPDGPHVGVARIMSDMVPVAVLHFELRVGATARDSRTRLQGTEQRIRSVFASYANDDRSQVLQWARGAMVAGVDVFVDVLTLRESSRWESELMKEVPAKDLFCLFWSAAASRSQWVEKEWKCALATRGLDYIHAVPLADPRLVPPPAELSGKHFGGLMFMAEQYERAFQAGKPGP